MKLAVLHLSTCDKFLPPFIKFIKENFDFTQHKFLLLSGMAENLLERDKNIFITKKTYISLIYYYLLTIIQMHRAKKIILHGLFDFRLVCILFCMPWLLKKCYWALWGGDLYIYKSSAKNFQWRLKEFFRRPVIKRVGYIISYIKGDFELAQKWYHSRAKYIECILYPSNLAPHIPSKPRDHKGIKILVGNSGSPSNNHLEFFEGLQQFKDEDILIFVPLTYGEKSYIHQVINDGKEKFGDKFIPITEHVSNSEYCSFLSTIDIAAFNHNRQQAMGNIISLLGLGKKVFINPHITSWAFFLSKNISVFNIKNFNITFIDQETSMNNIACVKKNFSEANYLKQLEAFIK